MNDLVTCGANDLTLTALGQLVEYIGAGISRAFYDSPLGVPVLRSNNVKGGRVILEDVKYWHNEDPAGADLEKVRPKAGDVLVNFVNGSQRELGKSAVFRGSPPNCIVSTNFFIVRTKHEFLLPDYLNYFLQSPRYRRWLYRTCGFSGQGSFNQEQLRSLELPLPPIRGQELRVSALLALDDVSAALVHSRDARLTFKRSLMEQLLTGKRRYPEHTRHAWISAQLGEAFVERNETNRPDLPLLSVTGDRGVIPRDELDKRDTSNPDKSKYKRVTVGDLAYNTMRMWQGVSALSTFEGIVSPAYTVAVPTARIDGRFARHLFKFAPVVHLFHRHSQGLVDDTLNLKFERFAKIKLKIPEDLAEQRRIADTLDLCDAEISLLEAQCEQFELYKRGLLAELLSGEVLVPP